MGHDLALALWFFLPAAVGNAAPIGAAALPGLRQLDFPLDCNAQFRGKRLLGSHKTWRGLLSGMLMAGAVILFQRYLTHHWGWAADIGHAIDYDNLPLLVMGPAMGLGALLGDAVKSFFKRQRGLPAGSTWIPFDQLDYVIGGTLASLLFVRLSLSVYIWTFILWFGLHFVASWIGWLLHLKPRPI